MKKKQVKDLQLFVQAKEPTAHFLHFQTLTSTTKNWLNKLKTIKKPPEAPPPKPPHKIVHKREIECLTFFKFRFDTFSIGSNLKWQVNG